MQPLLIFLLHLIMLFIGCAVSPATAQFDIWAVECTDTYGNYTSNSTFKSNLDALLSNITTLDIPYGFYNFSAGQKPDEVDAIALCRGDVNVTECQACLSFLKSNLTGSCPTQKMAIVSAEKCMLRYSTTNILGVWASSTLNNLRTEDDVGGNVDHFAEVVEALLMSLPNKTADGDYRLKFATGEASVNASLKVYALMQCTPDLIASDCLGCLYWNMWYVLYSDRGQTGARVFTPSCSIRYELYKFYVGSPSGSGKVSVNPRIVIIIVLGVVLVVIVLVFVILIWIVLRRRQQDKMRKKAINFKSSEVDFSIIKSATRNFSKKLGADKSRVYKGKLYGSEIAVKRIIDTRRSDGKDFKNAELIATKLQHTNLAEVLGFCVQGNERLVIFEYVSRGNLDQILFDPKHVKERAQLDWERRYVIIQGIAEGLLYLHEKYRYKILHGDLKAANVLLDEDWKPKITDIGTARLFQENQTSINANYMAPESNGGIISDKSDVYSFGVLVLEILAGRRRVIHDPEDLIPLAREKRNEGKVLEIIDQKIKPTTDSGLEMIRRCIDIALSCVNENAKDRPEMSSVVEMLTRQSCNYDQPSPPQFFEHSSPQPLLPNRYPSSSSSSSL